MFSADVFATMITRGTAREQLKDSLNALIECDMTEEEITDEIRSALEDVLPEDAMPEVRVSW